jgi:cytochrome c5
VLPVVALIVLVIVVPFGAKPGTRGDDLSDEAVARRLQPVGTLVFKPVEAPRVARTGEQVFQAQCSACHATGAAGAPKFGDVAAWAPRIPAGYAALLNSALKGKNAMTPQGGGAFSDDEVGRAVVFMANRAGASFDKPPAPAEAASAPDAAASR